MLKYIIRLIKKFHKSSNKLSSEAHADSAAPAVMNPGITKPAGIPFFAGPQKTPVIFVKNNYNQRVFLDPADHFITVHYLETLEWEDHLEEVYRDSLSNGGMYIDIGGNVGLHVLRAHRLGATSIFAFEPHPNTYNILKMNMELNGIFTGFHNIALGDKNGLAKLDTSYSAGMARIDENAENSIEVVIQTLSDFADQHEELKRSRLALVKIDVEGHEGEAIDGAIKFLKNFSNFNIIMEFGSPSSILAVEMLARYFEFDLMMYRFGHDPIVIDMRFVIDAEKRFSGDIVLRNLKPVESNKTLKAQELEEAV